MTTEMEIRATFAKQAVWCAQLGSPLTACLMEGLGVALDHSTQTGRKILGWSVMHWGMRSRCVWRGR